MTDTLTLALDTTPGHPILDTQRQIDSAFSVTAYDISGSPVTRFAKPFTITITHTDQDVKYVDGSSLKLYYWGEGRTGMRQQRTGMRQQGTGVGWQPIPTTVELTDNILISLLGENQVDHSLLNDAL